MVPGGVNEPLDAPRTATTSSQASRRRWRIAQRTLDWFKSEMEQFREEIRTFANFPTLFMGLVGDGRRAWSTTTASCASWMPAATWSQEGIEAAGYADYIGEMAHPWTYLKTPYLQAAGLSRGHLPRRARWRG